MPVNAQHGSSHQEHQEGTAERLAGRWRVAAMYMPA